MITASGASVLKSAVPSHRGQALPLVESFHGSPLPPATRRALHTAISHTRAR